MTLPEAPLRAFAADTFQKLAGFAELVGVLSELEDALRPKAYKHAWLGLTVTLPNGQGKIVKCLSHPYGEFMFDVDYPEPVPPISNGKIVLADNPAYYQQSHRFLAAELKDLAK